MKRDVIYGGEINRLIKKINKKKNRKKNQTVLEPSHGQRWPACLLLVNAMLEATGITSYIMNLRAEGFTINHKAKLNRND